MAAAPSLAFPSVRSVPPVVPAPSVPTAPPTSVRVPRPRSVPVAPPLFPDSPDLFPWMARRFAPGEATLWIGPARATESLLEILYAGCVAAGGRLSLLEGANRFHPYRIGERARSLGIDPGEALDRIRLARAFTAYQMIALVDGWAREVRRTRPTFLVAHEIPSLFFESEFSPEERGPLLAHAARVLAELARSTRLPMLITSATGFEGFPGLRESGPTLFDLVRVTPDPGGLALEAYREATRLALVHRPDGQHGLEEFVGEIAGEVTAWDGPSRRTGRRSRSG